MKGVESWSGEDEGEEDEGVGLGATGVGVGRIGGGAEEESRGGPLGRVREGGEKEFLVGMLQAGWASRVTFVDCLVGLRVLWGRQ